MTLPTSRFLSFSVAIASFLGAHAPDLTAQGLPGEVLAEQKISSTSGGFGGPLADSDHFGASIAHLGDLDGDGIDDLVVGATGDDGSGTDRGAVWILFMNANGTVASEQKISDALGGGGALDDNDYFGRAVARLGDLNGDGVPELAVGATGDGDGGPSRGAVWILFMNSDGTVASTAKISSTSGGFSGALDDLDLFGSSVAGLGDFDGDGVVDLAVGAEYDDDGSTSGLGRGAVWLLMLNTNGSVKSWSKISSTAGGFLGPLADDNFFGCSVATIGDLDSDGVVDLAVGARGDGQPGTARGAVWILLLNADGSVKTSNKIDEVSGLSSPLFDYGNFGLSVAALGDLDADGVLDVAAGAPFANGVGFARGEVHILSLAPDGSVIRDLMITGGTSGFVGPIDDIDGFGHALAAIGDQDGDGRGDLAVTVRRDDDGGTDRGAVWLLSLNAAIWSDLGFDLPGALGSPSLTGFGSLVAAEPLTIQLDNALPFSTAWFATSIFPLFAPFKGGVLVPNINPPGFILPLPIDALGSVTINTMWSPGVPTHTTFLMQYWIQDASGPAGFSASNALLAKTP